MSAIAINSIAISARPVRVSGRFGLKNWVLGCATLFAFVMMQAMDFSALPRNMKLKAFAPHRKDFTCVHEADKVPAIDPQTDVWYQQALSLTSPGKWLNGKDWPQALKLAKQAAARNHLKAMIFVAGTLSTGAGEGANRVSRDIEAAVQMIEAAMKLGVPAAFDAMGTFHQDGTGVKRDVSRAYAFWEIAADLGNAEAQAALGVQLWARCANGSRQRTGRV